MLHTVGVYGVGFAVHLIAHVLIRVIAAASHHGIKRMQCSVGIVIVASGFHFRVVIPVIARGSCKKHRSKSGILGNFKGHIFLRHLKSKRAVSFVGYL